MTAYEQKLSDMVESIAAPKVRAMMKVTQATRKHPLDCLTDGGLELLVAYILALEKATGKSDLKN